MLSEKQKRVLFGSRIESRPRYVRVPLQMKNGVRELNTDVNFHRLLQLFDRADATLRGSTTEPITHIRMDLSGCRDWIGMYDRYCSAYRGLNSSRIVRRMQITGYRLVNVICHRGGYDIMTDAYVRGVDEACVILDMIARTILPSGHQSVLLDLDGSLKQRQALRSTIVSSGYWRRGWRMESQIVSGKLTLRADRSEIVEALNSAYPSGVRTSYRPISWGRGSRSTSNRWSATSSNNATNTSTSTSCCRVVVCDVFNASAKSHGYDGTGIIPMGRAGTHSRRPDTDLRRDGRQLLPGTPGVAPWPL